MTPCYVPRVRPSGKTENHELPTRSARTTVEINNELRTSKKTDTNLLHLKKALQWHLSRSRGMKCIIYTLRNDHIPFLLHCPQKCVPAENTFSTVTCVPGSEDPKTPPMCVVESAREGPMTCTQRSERQKLASLFASKFGLDLKAWTQCRGDSAPEGSLAPRSRFLPQSQEINSQICFTLLSASPQFVRRCVVRAPEVSTAQLQWSLPRCA